VRDVVNFRVCEIMIVLELIVATSCKCSMKGHAVV
jgi:hypothetical protein